MSETTTPDEAIARMVESMNRLESELIPLHSAHGRILTKPVMADRPSPAADVSAMDGYALRTTDLRTDDERLIVSGESAPGHAPPESHPGQVMRVFTGAIVPAEFDLVIKREDTDEDRDSIALRHEASLYQPGDNIRRQGENVGQGATVVDEGERLHPGAIAAAANFGCDQICVSKRLRVSVLVTGNELQPVHADVEPWQLRDSNGPTLNAILGGHEWIDVLSVEHVPDHLGQLTDRLAGALEHSDAVILTGGVSMGDHDHVPEAVSGVGGQVVFHRLPIRPGRPILGATTADGRPIFGLPGNPVSAAVGCRRFVLPVLGRQANRSDRMLNRPLVRLENPDGRTLPLHWFRLVELIDGNAVVVPSKGSGDLVALAKSDGFIEQVAGQSGPGPWAYWNWSD